MIGLSGCRAVTKLNEASYGQAVLQSIVLSSNGS
jgi:hypothetical protein